MIRRSYTAAGVSLMALSLAACGALGSALPDQYEGKGGDKASAEASASTAPLKAAEHKLPAGTWAHEASDLKPDPALRFGKLPNGMRYVIMKNATPPEQASLRLRIGAGSLHEREDQRGIAHFLEHMAFNGSKNVPEGEMIKRLERHGLKFGPDTNAFTSFDQTVYMLDLPRTDAATLREGLFLMRETAGNLLLAEDAINRERGVILSEERARDTPGLRVALKRYDFLLKDQLVPQRFPIGQREIIANAQRQAFVDFYQAWYRPERATIVAIGDFDPATVESEITRLFSDWRSASPTAAEPVLGDVAPRRSETRLVVEPGSPASVSVAWTNPPDRDLDTAAKRKANLVRQLGFAVLNRRLERVVRSAERPFLGAAAYRYTDTDSADITLVSVTAEPGKLAPALVAAEQEQRRAAKFGVTQAEIEREITEMRAALTAQATGAATRRTPALASGVIDAVNDREVPMSPVDELALFEASVKGVDAAQVSAELSRQFEGQGPLVFATSPEPVEGGEAALAQAFTTSRATEVKPATAVAQRPWPYTDFGAPGQVAERREVTDLGATFVRFANGVRLTVKPTKFRNDQILVAARVGGGRLDQPKDAVNQDWMLGSVFPEGGLKQLTAEELDQSLAGRVAGSNFSVGDEAYALSGATRPEDFAVQMQLLAAYVKEPGWRTEPWERIKAYASTVHNQLESTPGGVFQRDGDALLHGGDQRWAWPTREQIAQARFEDLRSLVEPSLQNGPIEVVVVGDVTVEEAIRQTSLTFGALPARPAPTPSPADRRAVRFPDPTPEPVVRTHKGRADQAFGFVAWPFGDFPSDPRRARTVRLLEQILQLRMTDELREGQALTYSPQTDYEAAWAWPGYGYVGVAVEAPPEKLADFDAAVSKIVADLQAKPVSADELERARAPRIEQLEKAQTTNEYWLSVLAQGQTDPRRLDAVRSSISGLERVTASDIQAVARTYLKPERAFRMRVLPEARPAQ